jgi:Kef-type K+ transport system membrane component KefB
VTPAIPAHTIDDAAHALSALTIGAIAFGLASLSLTRHAVKLLRHPVAAALIGGGWVALAAGALLGPLGCNVLKDDSLLELRPLLQLGLAWIGFLVGLQLKRSVLAQVPGSLWRWIALDAAVSVVGGGAVAACILRPTAPDGALGTLWIPCALVACATVGWSGELRSLRGLDARAPQLATLIHAGAGLGSAAAVLLYGVAALQASDAAAGASSLDAAHGALGLLITAAVSLVAAAAIHAALRLESWSDGRIIATLVGALAFVAGVATALHGSPMLGACLLGAIITNKSSGALRRLERLVAESEVAVASMFFLLAGAMLSPSTDLRPWWIAAALLALRGAVKSPVARACSGAAWPEPGARAMHVAPVRQAPIAIVLAAAALIERSDPSRRGALMALAACGVASHLIPLLWRARR